MRFLDCARLLMGVGLAGTALVAGPGGGHQAMLRGEAGAVFAQRLASVSAPLAPWVVAASASEAPSFKLAQASPCDGVQDAPPTVRVAEQPEVYSGIWWTIQEWLARANRDFQGVIVRGLSVPSGTDVARDSEGDDPIARKIEEDKAKTPPSDDEVAGAIPPTVEPGSPSEPGITSVPDTAGDPVATSEQDNEIEQDNESDTATRATKANAEAEARAKAAEAAAEKVEFAKAEERAREQRLRAQEQERAAALAQDRAADEQRKLARERELSRARELARAEADAAAARQGRDEMRSDPDTEDVADAARREATELEDQSRRAERRIAEERSRREAEWRQASEAALNRRNFKLTVEPIPGIVRRPLPVVQPRPFSGRERRRRARVAGYYRRSDAGRHRASRDLGGAHHHCRGAGRKVRPSRRYVVKRGDSLWRIARKHYRKGRLYPIIYRANRGRIRDPDLIFPCQKLRVPRR